MEDLNNLTLKELQQIARNLGVDKAEKLLSKDAAISVISALQSKTVAPVIDDSQKDVEKYESKKERMKRHLDAQPKVRFLIPLDIGEKKGAIETVILNGYRYNIPKGEFVEIPQQVADVLSDAYKLTSTAGANIRLDRVDPKTNKPVADILA
jgi:hypothetical protein